MKVFKFNESQVDGICTILLLSKRVTNMAICEDYSLLIEYEDMTGMLKIKKINIEPDGN